jgi:hypothetical protein
MGPVGWRNPITLPAGQIQTGLDPNQLIPSRGELIRHRVEFQRRLMQSRQKRMTPIRVTQEGVIWDGHHAIRAAAELGIPVDVLVVAQSIPPSGLSIMQLPIG